VFDLANGLTWIVLVANDQEGLGWVAAVVADGVGDIGAVVGGVSLLDHANIRRSNTMDYFHIRFKWIPAFAGMTTGFVSFC
jgi:hypothetical protein